MAEDDLQHVRALYESFPFPARDPGSEDARRLPASRTDILGKVNHHCFGGKRDFTKQFRVLVAGGGTGDSVIFLAAQLRDTDAEIVYLDFSDASLSIARRRAAARDLEQRIRWVNGSLLDAGRLGLGPFDYITCLGVLHHLDDPDAGLRSLTDVLAEGGAMGLMVYGRYGRQARGEAAPLLRRLRVSAPERISRDNNTADDRPGRRSSRRAECFPADSSGSSCRRR
jgi:SAM-dependent methyltransferase